MDRCRRRHCRRGRHHRARPGCARRRGVRRPARSRQPLWAGRRRRRGRIREGGSRRVHSGLGRDHRRQREPARRPVAGQLRPARRRLVLQDQARRCPPARCAVRRTKLRRLRQSDLSLCPLLRDRPMPMPSAAQHPVPLGALENATEFLPRHIGIDADDQAPMLSVIGETARRALIDSIVPRSIARRQAMELPLPVSEAAALAELRALAARNQVLRSFIGQGYYGTHTPGVILRNILENPAWYTAYTPYQAEISQGRMEALVNFQTMVCDLTGMPIANASMLDEATAAAEAMMLARRSVPSGSQRFIVAGDTHPQTIEVIQTRAGPLGIEVVRTEGAAQWQAALAGDYFAVLAQYPASSGRIDDLRADVQQVQARQAAFIVAADLLALTLITAPGEWGADIVVGSSQRFGMPMGAGGPHAAYMACRDEFKRSRPGRLVGVSRDAHGRPAYRLALQTREQHIRREKATSNICTAQVLPAVVASMYAVYHGPQGLKRIAQRVASFTALLAQGLKSLGLSLAHASAFDTLQVRTGAKTDALLAAAVTAGMNFRRVDADSLSLSLDETTTRDDLHAILVVFSEGRPVAGFDAFEKAIASLLPADLLRGTAYLTHPVFNTHHSETEMLRYLRALADKDLALDRTMIPLGSCTMN